MRFLFAFLPALSFLVVQRIGGAHAALLVAAVVAVGCMLYNLLVRHVGLKILDLGSMAIFGGLAIYVQCSGAEMSLAAIRLAVDSGLMLISLGSILIGRPFTLQYAVRRAAGNARVFRAHVVITLAWAAAFAGMDVVDAVWMLHAGLPPAIMLCTTALFSFAAYRFTRWYPQHVGIRTSADAAR